MSTHACCPDCGLRFGRPAAPEAADCPHCGSPLAHLPAALALGYRLDARACIPGLTASPPQARG